MSKTENGTLKYRKNEENRTNLNFETSVFKKSISKSRMRKFSKNL